MVAGSPPRAWGLFLSLGVIVPYISVHPHVRGAYWLTLIYKYRLISVHPHVRGAYVTLRGYFYLHYAVHPHVRGAYYPHCCYIKYLIGSPPRAWGLWFFDSSYSWLTRFTPTCVGLMEFGRGEVNGKDGSPPRAWGLYSEITVFIH